MPLRCHHCDHELTGCTGERCPECGTPIDNYKADRKAARRRLDRAALRSALVGLFALVASLSLRFMQERFSLVSFGLLFAGAGWLLIVFVVWWMEGIETR